VAYHAILCGQDVDGTPLFCALVDYDGGLQPGVCTRQPRRDLAAGNRDAEILRQIGDLWIRHIAQMREQQAQALHIRTEFAPVAVVERRQTGSARRRGVIPLLAKLHIVRADAQFLLHHIFVAFELRIRREGRPDPVSAPPPGRSESGPACCAWCAVWFPPAPFPTTATWLRQYLWAGRVCRLRLCGGSVAPAGTRSRPETCADPPSATRSDSAAAGYTRGHAVLDACNIDITKNPINRADSGLATHQFSVKQPGAICPANQTRTIKNVSAPRYPRIIEKIPFAHAESGLVYR